MAPYRAITFYGLNALRALSLVSLLLVFSSTIFVMVNNIKAVNFFEANQGRNQTVLDGNYIANSTVPHQSAGVFWAIVSSLLVIFQTIVLILSEVGLPYFDRFFPVLGTSFGLGPLGIFQGLISTQILSHHVDKFTLVSAFFLFAIGCLNMLFGLIYRESAKPRRSIRRWRADSKAVLPTFVNDDMFGRRSPTGSVSEKDTTYSSDTKYDTWSSSEKGSGFGRQAERSAGLRGFVLQMPEESLGRYATPVPTLTREPRSSESSRSSFTSSPRMSSMRTSESLYSTPSRAGTPVPVFKSSPTAL